MITLNEIQIKPTIFPDKTSQVWHLPKGILTDNTNTINWEYKNEAELFHICQLADLISSEHKRCFLRITYLPYGRQDKEISNDTTFALHTFARIINSCNFLLVTFLDGHSKEAEKLINRGVDLFPYKPIQFAIKNVDNPLLAYPDKGAFLRYNKALRNKAIIGEKVRDQKTGYISHFKILGDPENRNILMIDDLCDGGMTFKIMARDLIEAGCKSVNLYVTHGIFSKGIQTLKDSGISKIFTHKGEIK